MRIPALLFVVSRRIATWRWLIVTAVLYVGSAAAIFLTPLPFGIPRVTARCGAAPPDVRFFTSGAEVRRFVVDCGDAGRASWLHLQLADLVFPVISGLFLASALALVLTRSCRPGSPVIAMAVLPLIGTALDYLENLAAWVVLGAFPADVPVATELLGVMSIGKQVVTWTAWVLLILALGRVLVRRRPRRRTDRGLATGHRGSAPDRPRPPAKQAAASSS